MDRMKPLCVPRKAHCCSIASRAPVALLRNALPNFATTASTNRDRAFHTKDSEPKRTWAARIAATRWPEGMGNEDAACKAVDEDEDEDEVEVEGGATTPSRRAAVTVGETGRRHLLMLPAGWSARTTEIVANSSDAPSFMVDMQVN